MHLSTQSVVLVINVDVKGMMTMIAVMMMI